MPVVQVAAEQPGVRDASLTALDAALRELDGPVEDGSRPPFAQLAAACTAARTALADPGATAAGGVPLHLLRIDERIQACFARAARWMLAATPLGEPLPAALSRAAAALLRELSQAYARVAAAAEGRDSVLPLLRALWCMGMAAKWTYFMQVGADGALWRSCHALYQRAEKLGVARQPLALYRDPDLGELTCADVYVQSLLMGMLNAGNLSPQQIELAHRWASTFVRDAGIEPDATGAPQVFHVCLDSDRGLQLGAPPAGSLPAVRFVDIEPICVRLIDSRENLRRGRIDLADARLQIAVLDYGAFLDLAERFWNPGANKVQERAPRVASRQQALQLLTGFEALHEAVAGKAGVRTRAPQPPATSGNVSWLPPPAARPAGVVMECLLKDRSDTGLGVLASAQGGCPAVGSLIGYRMAADEGWCAGMIVRRLAAPDGGQILLGIKRISEAPVRVTLRVGRPGAAAAAGGPTDAQGLFAPMDGVRSRVDTLILGETTYALGLDFVLPAGAASFHVRLTRLLDRGPGWVRAGFQVLGKA